MKQIVTVIALLFMPLVTLHAAERVTKSLSEYLSLWHESCVVSCWVSIQQYGDEAMSDEMAARFHQVPEALWLRIERLLPVYKVSCKGGRPRLSLRNVVGGILYVLSTGSQWKAMPKQFGSGSAIHAYFQAWVKRGVFQRLWALAVTEYDDLKGIDWTWQSMDGAMTKAPLGGEKNGEKSDGSWETRREAFPAHRWSRRATGDRRGRSQCV